MFVLTELAARPGQQIESSLSDMTSEKQIFFPLTKMPFPLLKSVNQIKIKN